jgi:hypothetical protein
MYDLLAEAAAAALTRGTEALFNCIDVAEINCFNFQAIVDHAFANFMFFVFHSVFTSFSNKRLKTNPVQA